MGVYSTIYLLPHLELYLKIRKVQKKVPYHLLRFRFKQHSLVVTLTGENCRLTRFFVTPGLFLKYFKCKKSLKRGKAMKLLLIRFVRKMILVLRLRHLNLHLRGVPLYIELFLEALNRPLAHAFNDPFTGKIIDETRNERELINFSKLEI